MTRTANSRLATWTPACRSLANALTAEHMARARSYRVANLTAELLWRLWLMGELCDSHAGTGG